MIANEAVETVNDTGLDSHNMDKSAEQFLTFIMADEEYGVDILCVQEIRGWEKTTPLPNAPKHIKGVINLRGTVVPIIDLRLCFGMDAIEYTAVTVVIVLRVTTEQGDRTMGIVVDAVSDVYTLNENDMRAAPDLGNSTNTEFIRGLVTVEEKMVILLNIEKLLVIDELPSLADITKQLKD